MTTTPFLFAGKFHYANLEEVTSIENDVTTLYESATQKFTLTGYVRDNNGDPLTGATILIKGGSGTIADINGKYMIDVSVGDILIFSYIGYETVSFAADKRTKIDVVLRENINSIGEVVVVGYGQQKKESVTGAISSISTKDLKQTPSANISNMLVGRLPGLTAIQGTGKPGSDASALYIRGISTYTGGVSPLIMVDGVARDTYNDIDPNEIESLSILKDASATAVYGVRGANGVILITTKRGTLGKPKISFSAETAINTFSNLPKFVGAVDYANLENEYNFERYWYNHAKDNDVTSWDTFVSKRSANWKREATLYFSDSDIKYYQNAHTPKLVNGQTNPYYDPILHPDVDWQSKMFNKTGRQTQYNVNINGGSEKIKYFVSLGYFNQGGMFKTDYLPFGSDCNYRSQRYNLRGNFDFYINKDFTISLDLGTQYGIVSGIPGDDGYIWGRGIMWSNPLSTPGYIDGKFIQAFSGVINATNAMFDMTNWGYNNSLSSTLTSAVKLNYKLDFITKGLSVNAKTAYDSYFASNQTHYQPVILWKVTPNPNGDLTDPIYSATGQTAPATISSDNYTGKWRKIYGEMSLNYNRTFGNHEVGALGLYNMEKRYDPNLQYNLPHAYQSLVGRLTYGFAKKYLAEFNLGYNGSENFPQGKRFGLFPAYSAGWVASNESFFPKNDIVTYIKVRGAYGKVGNDNIGGSRYLYLPSTWKYNGGYNFGGLANRNYITGAEESVVGNPNVTWEVSTKGNIGFEGRFIKDQLSINFDYYSEDRTNILSYKQTIPDIVQATLPPYNLGEVKSWGYEIEAGWRSHIGKVSYWLKGNASFNNNKIVFMDEAITPGLEYQSQTGNPIGQPLILKTAGLYTSWSQLYKLDNNGNPDLSNPILALDNNGNTYNNKIGNPVYVKGLGYNGAPIQPGELKYIDFNHDGVIDSKDAVRSGETFLPKVTYGMSFGFNYKGFDISALFQGVYGVAKNYYNLPFAAMQAIPEVGLNRFTIDRYNSGDKIEYPLAAFNVNAPANDFFLKDGSYLRLKNLQIGYTITPAFLKNYGIESARLYVNGSNLYTWAPNLSLGDPENLGSQVYPITKTFNIGVNLNF